MATRAGTQYQNLQDQPSSSSPMGTNLEDLVKSVIEWLDHLDTKFDRMNERVSSLEAPNVARSDPPHPRATSSHELRSHHQEPIPEPVSRHQAQHRDYTLESTPRYRDHHREIRPGPVFRERSNPEASPQNQSLGGLDMS